MDSNSEQLLDRLVSALKVEAKRMVTNIEECQKVRLAVQNSLEERHTVDMGSGYFATVSKFDTLKFLDRKVLRYQKILNELDRKLKPAEALVTQLVNLSKAQGVPSFNEQSLPIVEIQEHLDENGQLLDVSLRDTQGNETNCHTFASNIAPDLDHDTMSTKNVDLRDEILSDYSEVHASTSIDQNSLKPSEEDVDVHIKLPITGSVSEKLVVEEGSNRDGSISLVNQSIYELELLAREVDESSEALDDCLNAGLSSKDSWLDADSESDDMEETRFALLIPHNSALQNRLWDEVKRLRSKKAEIEPLATPASSKVFKSVRFSEMLDIKTIEDTHTNLPSFSGERKILKFKSDRLSLSNDGRLQLLELAEPNRLNSQQRITNDVEENLGDSNRKMSESISASHLNYEIALEDPAFQEDHPQDHDGDETLQITIASNETPMSLIDGDSKGQEDYCVTQARTEDSEILANHVQESKFDHQRTHALRHREPMLKTFELANLIHNKQTPSLPSEEQVYVTNANFEPATEIGAVPQLDVNHFPPGNETDAMARAYIAGHFDNNKMVAGPIVNELNDFKILNELVASFDKGTSLEEKARVSKEEMESDKFDSDEEILKREIVEKVPDLEHVGELSSDILHTFDSVQTSVFQHEIQSEYHRLRQKILAKELTSDQEYEPIDNEPRLSRFRSARRQFN